MERDAALELLRAQHVFPGPFEFRVVVRPAATATVVGAMIAASGPDARTEDVSERKSGKGNFVALHVRLHVPDAERVLEVWEVLKHIDGVVMTM